MTESSAVDEFRQALLRFERESPRAPSAARVTPGFYDRLRADPAIIPYVHASPTGAEMDIMGFSVTPSREAKSDIEFLVRKTVTTDEWVTP